MEEDEEKSNDFTNYYGSLRFLLSDTLKKVNGKEMYALS